MFVRGSFFQCARVDSYCHRRPCVRLFVPQGIGSRACAKRAGKRAGKHQGRLSGFLGGPDKNVSRETFW